MGKLLLSCQIKLSVKTEAVLTIEKSVTDVVKLFHYHLADLFSIIRRTKRKCPSRVLYCLNVSNVMSKSSKATR